MSIIKKLYIIFFITIILGGTAYWFLSKESSEQNQNYNYNMGNLSIRSSAFKEGEFMPPKYTCDGDNINPLLEIRGVPENAKSLVLIMEDPDAPAGTWDHWILWNISPKTQYIAEDSQPEGSRQGKTSFGKNQYGGPCPPPGKPHRYYFKVFALDTTLNLPDDATKKDVEKAMEGHILDQASLMGLYKR